MKRETRVNVSRVWSLVTALHIVDGHQRGTEFWDSFTMCYEDVKNISILNSKVKVKLVVRDQLHFSIFEDISKVCLQEYLLATSLYSNNTTQD